MSAARQLKRRVGKPRYTRPMLDVILLSRLHRNQALIYDWQQQVIVDVIHEAEEKCAREPSKKIKITDVLTEEQRNTIAEINTFLARTSPAMVAALTARAKLDESQPTEQLEAQFRAELLRAATTLTDEEWELLARTRAETQERADLRQPRECRAPVSLMAGGGICGSREVERRDGRLWCAKCGVRADTKFAGEGDSNPRGPYPREPGATPGPATEEM